MKYDDYTWHINDDFPKDLNKKAAAIHIGMYMGWILDNNLESELLRNQYPEQIEYFKKGKITGTNFIYNYCDGKLISDDIDITANKFTQYYYESSMYIDDYINLSNQELESIFYEPDSLDKYLQIKEIINLRFIEWMKSEKNS